MKVRGIPLELQEETVVLPGRALSLLRPRDAEALLDEEAFEHEEYLPYWAELWPSGVALARAIAPRSLRGASVLELGCGLAVPSIVAALAGGRALATDWSAEALRFATLNAERNGAQIETALCSWADPALIVERAPWQLVLGSDVLYERRNAELLLDLLPRLVDGRGEVLLADPGRPHTSAFLDAAAADWEVVTASDPVSGHVSIHVLRRRLE